MNILAELSLTKCLMFPLWNPVKEILCFQSLPLHVSLEFSVLEPFLQVPLTKPVQTERCSTSKAFLDTSRVAFRVHSKGSPSSHTDRRSVSRALLHLSLELTGKRTPLQVPYRCPYGENCSFPEACQHGRKCRYFVLIYKIVAKGPKKQSLREYHASRGFRALLDPLNY